MTAAHQLSIDDALAGVSEPIAGETAATVELVGNDAVSHSTEHDWWVFSSACRQVARFHGYVDANLVRSWLRPLDSPIPPRRFSAFWHRAAKGKDAFLVADGWVTNSDSKGRNQGKPLRRYRLRSP